MSQATMYPTGRILQYVVLCAANQGPQADGYLFRDDEDRREFLRRLSGALDKERVDVHGLCFANSDVRLLLESSGPSIGLAIQYVCSHFAHWSNRKHGRSGPLFRQRYRAVPFGDRLLLRVIRHLHRTPIDAGLTSDLDRYPWSSHGSYVGSHVIPWVTTHRLLRMFSLDPIVARQKYRRFVTARAAPKHSLALMGNGMAAPPHEFCRGDRPFLRWLTAQERLEHLPATLEQIVMATCKRFQIELDDLVSSSRVRRLSLARAVVAWHTTRSGIATLGSVAMRLNRDPSTLVEGCQRYRALYPELFQVGIEAFLHGTEDPTIEDGVRRTPSVSGLQASRRDTMSLR